MCIWFLVLYGVWLLGLSIMYVAVTKRIRKETADVIKSAVKSRQVKPKELTVAEMIEVVLKYEKQSHDVSAEQLNPDTESLMKGIRTKIIKAQDLDIHWNVEEREDPLVDSRK